MLHLVERPYSMQGYDEAGFSFYTNHDSRKASELAGGRAAGCFFWEAASRQVRVEGSVERLPDAESDSYFQRYAASTTSASNVQPLDQDSFRIEWCLMK